MSARVTVVGDVMLDVVARSSGPAQPTSDTPAAVHVGRGGSAANAALRLAAAGCAVTYVGAIGRDDVGRVVRGAFARAGIETRFEEVDAPTGVVVAVVDESGQRAMFTSRGANSRLGPDHVARALEAAAEHVHVSGYTLLDDETRAVGRAAVALARERHGSVSVDACSIGPLARLGAATFLEAVAPATILFANEEEARLLAGGPVETALERLADRFEEVVVTLGADGAVARAGGVLYRASARGGEVLDTTGAGDAATGAYLAARLSGAPVGEALDVAMLAASEVVTALGADGQSRW